MPRTELMLRMIMGRDIRDHAWTLLWGQAKQEASLIDIDAYDLPNDALFTIYSVDGKTNWDDYPHCLVPDSFELGIKAGEDWWFEGDIIILKYPVSNDLKGILFVETGCMLIKFDDYIKYEPIPLLNVKGWITRPSDIGYCKRIGNIHEEGNDA